MQPYIALVCLFGTILGINGIRIEVAKFGISPTEPRIEFYNPLTSGIPAPVMEDSDDNRLQPQGPMGAGYQIENVVQALRYRYPDPTTTPRPFTAAARNPVPPHFPTAYAQPRPEPLPTPPPTRIQPFLVSQDGTLITGNQIDLTEYQTPQQREQAQAIQAQADMIQMQRQNQLAEQLLRQAQDQLQQRILRRQQLRAMALQQEREEAARQQAQQFGQPQYSTADLSQVQNAPLAVQPTSQPPIQPPVQAVQPIYQTAQSPAIKILQPTYSAVQPPIPSPDEDFQTAFHAIQSVKPNLPASIPDFHATFQPTIETLTEQPVTYEQPLPLVQPPPQQQAASSGVSYTRTYHVSRVADPHK